MSEVCRAFGISRKTGYKIFERYKEYDLAVNGDRIAAVGSGLASHARQVIERDGNLVTAGSVNMHVRVFEWMITFGLPPDDAGSIPARPLRSTRAARAYTLSDPPLSL
jgi:hypothetical protein